MNFNMLCSTFVALPEISKIDIWKFFANLASLDFWCRFFPLTSVAAS